MKEPRRDSKRLCLGEFNSERAGREMGLDPEKNSVSKVKPERQFLE